MTLPICSSNSIREITGHESISPTTQFVDTEWEGPLSEVMLLAARNGVLNNMETMIADFICDIKPQHALLKNA